MAAISEVQLIRGKNDMLRLRDHERCTMLRKW